ncbi:MAG: hypothetical protein GY720_24045 [bacterium]|nr:hypothetical protein [bacterium]
MTKTRLIAGLAAIVVLALVAAVLGFGQGRSCTDLACGDRVIYSIPDEAYVAWGAEPTVPVAVETCIDDECRTSKVTVSKGGKMRGTGPEVFLAEGTLDLGGVYTITLKVTGPSSMVRYARTDTGATLSDFQPNGPDCDPTCARWLLAIEPEDLGL